MSWFGRLFAKKTGGTRIGNAIRRSAYKNTYGLLGTESGRPDNPWVVPKEGNNISNPQDGNGSGDQMWWGN